MVKLKMGKQEVFAINHLEVIYHIWFIMSKMNCVTYDFNPESTFYFLNIPFKHVSESLGMK